jgi:hypothetical protein
LQATAIVEGFRSTFSDYFEMIHGRVKSIHQSINQIATVSFEAERFQMECAEINVGMCLAQTVEWETAFAASGYRSPS